MKYYLLSLHYHSFNIKIRKALSAPTSDTDKKLILPTYTRCQTKINDVYFSIPFFTGEAKPQTLDKIQIIPTKNKPGTKKDLQIQHNQRKAMDKGLEKTGLQCGVATCSEGFEKCFLRFRQAIAAQASKMTFQRTHNKTLETSCRPSLYIKCVLPEAVSFFPSSKSFKLISCV